MLPFAMDALYDHDLQAVLLVGLLVKDDAAVEFLPRSRAEKTQHESLPALDLRLTDRA